MGIGRQTYRWTVGGADLGAAAPRWVCVVRWNGSLRLEDRIRGLKAPDHPPVRRGEGRVRAGGLVHPMKSRLPMVSPLWRKIA